MSVSSDECHGRNFLFDFFPCSRQLQFHGPTAAAFRSHVFCWRPLSIFVVCFSLCCHWWNSWLGRVTMETIRLICLWTYPGTVSTPACTFVYNGAACSAFSGTQNPLQACAGRLFTAKRQTQRLRIIHRISSKKIAFFFLTQKIFYSSRSSRDTARAFFTWNKQCEWASFRLSLNSLFPTPASFYGRRVLWNSFRALTRTSPFSNFFFIHSVGTSISRRRVHWIFRLQFQRHVTFWTNVQ